MSHLCDCRRCHLPIKVVKSALCLTPVFLDPDPDDTGNIRIMDDQAHLDDGTFIFQTLPSPTYRQHQCGSPHEGQ